MTAHHARSVLLLCSISFPGCKSGFKPGEIADAGVADSGGVYTSPLASICGLSPSACPVAPTYPQQLIDWVKQSQPFRGTVTTLNVTSPDGNQDPSRQVYIRVDQAWPSDSFLSGFVGLNNAVIMVMKDASAFAPGYVGYFFGTLSTVGKNVTLVELAHTDSNTMSNLDSSIPDIQRLLKDRKLYDQISQSNLIIHGKVTAITPLPHLGGFSEHEADWAEASVDVTCALHGTASGTSVPIRFATSRDVAWVSKPKLLVNDDAIYLLRVDTITGEAGAAYVVDEPLDVHAPIETQHLIDLMSCPPREAGDRCAQRIP